MSTHLAEELRQHDAGFAAKEACCNVSEEHVAESTADDIDDQQHTSPTNLRPAAKMQPVGLTKATVQVSVSNALTGEKLLTKRDMICANCVLNILTE